MIYYFISFLVLLVFLFGLATVILFWAASGLDYFGDTQVEDELCDPVAKEIFEQMERGDDK